MVATLLASLLPFAGVYIFSCGLGADPLSYVSLRDVVKSAGAPTALAKVKYSIAANTLAPVANAVAREQSSFAAARGLLAAVHPDTLFARYSRLPGTCTAGSAPAAADELLVVRRLHCNSTLAVG